ncbi:MAG TPA: NUDIX hydrolase [Acidimicrobiales bacterium]|nr:NUDIX hydrolase [Acidimicrobiales bacterium]
MTTVRAAGGVVWRTGDDGVEVLLVHRPKYDDWTLPKGKADGDELDEDCALREVREETGLRCLLGDYVGETSYRDRFGRPKVARYWAMRPLGRAFHPSDEVDEVRWLSPAEAAGILTYERDAALLATFRPPL